MAVAEGCEIVFQLAGVKGSPAMTATRPASFFVPTITFNTNMMEAARRQGVQRYLFTSSIGVYAPSEVFFEDDVWKTFPSPNDRFAGWAKRMGELQARARRSPSLILRGQSPAWWDSTGCYYSTIPNLMERQGNCSIHLGCAHLAGTLGFA
jgi:nucleoside-diphosphate-sugar epimerase